MDKRSWTVVVAGRIYKTGLKRVEAADVYRDLVGCVHGVHIVYGKGI